MIVFYSGADNHMAVVPETVLRERASVMLTYVELRKDRRGRGNSRFRRWAKRKRAGVK